MIVRVRADLQADVAANGVSIVIPVPSTTSTAHISLDGSGSAPAHAGSSSGEVTVEAGAGGAGEQLQKATLDTLNGRIMWNVKRFMGLKEHVLRARITLSEPRTKATQLEISPISMDFEIPMYNCSNIHITYLRIVERSEGYDPYKWIRYISQARSYAAHTY